MSFLSRLRLFPFLFMVFAGACTSADANPARSATAPREIVVTTLDFAFRAADTIPEGLTRIRMKNEGAEFHHVQLVRLEGGHIMKDLLDRLAAGDFAPSWATFVGGPDASALGHESEATLELTPGNYALICVIASKDRVRHVAKGMAHALTVTPSYTPATSEAEPKADVRMTLSDCAFEITPEIRSGRRTIRVENAAEQPHHVAFIRLLPGKTAADAREWDKTHNGPPPFEPAGGATMLASQKVNYVTMDFVPGEYILLCFVPDAKDGRPHVAHGMMRQVTVE